MVRGGVTSEVDGDVWWVSAAPETETEVGGEQGKDRGSVREGECRRWRREEGAEHLPMSLTAVDAIAAAVGELDCRCRGGQDKQRCKSQKAAAGPVQNRWAGPRPYNHSLVSLALHLRDLGVSDGGGRARLSGR